MRVTSGRVPYLLVLCLAVLVCIFLALDADSQPSLSRRTTTTTKKSSSVSKGAVSKSLKITKITGLGSRGMVTAPRFEYRDTGFPGSKGTRRDWARIELSYETAPEWIDQHTVRFYVLMRNGNVPKPKSPDEEPEKEYNLLRGSISYMLVAKGRHVSDMFIHPNVLERYGTVVAIGAEMSYGDEEVSKADASSRSGLAKPFKWWQEVVKSDKVASRDGLLLKRGRTPFALVNYWDYDMSRD